LGVAAGVGAVVVVGVEVFVEVTLEAGHLGDERSGEGRPPAPLEDGELGGARRSRLSWSGRP
jgi:hypothetical protein